ncbi:MAG: dipeptidyl aminopeptidase/acylaminoacyl peptidase, partial [Planctomycetota bacterium]
MSYMQSVLSLFFGLTVFVADGRAQDGYRLPPQEIVDIIDAEAAPSLRISPDGKTALVIKRDSLPSIEDVSRRMLRLAGMRIDPETNARHRTSFDRGLAVKDLDSGAQHSIKLPKGAKLASVSWSHNSHYFAFTLVVAGGSELWATSIEADCAPIRLSKRLNTVLSGPRWMPDGVTMILSEVPEDRGEEPAVARAPHGPNIQSTSGATSPLRTYQDLLSNEHDEALFEHYARSQLVIVKVKTAERMQIGRPRLYRSVDPSPDGNQLLVTRIQKPYSYLMPYYSFPHTVEVLDQFARLLATIVRVPLAEGIPIQGVRTGPRDVGWRRGVPASLVWTEALDGGDPNIEAPHRDRWLTWDAPFKGEGKELLRLQQRARGLSFLQDPELVLAGEYDRDRRWIRTLLFDLRTPDADTRVVEDRSIRDRYGDPGTLLNELDEQGRSVPIQDGSWIYRAGSGASPEGLLPFLSRQNLDTLETEQLWRCSQGSYESVVKLVGHGGEINGEAAFVTRHESTTSPPNYRLRRLNGTEPAALTEFPDPTPQIRGVHKELVTYERADGVPLSATLYLPADYEQGTRLPLFVWAYPREFNDPKTAGQVTTSAARFTRISGSSHLALVTQGYAVLDAATMPIIGDPKTMNDTFREQIVAAAQAAIDKAVDMGVADRERVAVGGHSYGAFMTANLLAHCDLFRAGIARSGAYNRSLTPFGFQSERRTFWEAPDAYFNVSPFMHADKINEALLMIHG